MKILYNILLISLAILLCSLSKCNEDPDNPTNNNGGGNNSTEEQLPPITTTGAGTFGCKVNGKVWVAKTNKTSWFSTYASINRSVQFLTNISGTIRKDDKEWVVINVLFKNENKQDYSIGFNNDNDPKGQYYDVNQNTFWRTDSIRGGTVTLLRYDTTRQIVSGTFAFKCANPDTHDTMNITDGRFDMHYTY